MITAALQSDHPCPHLGTRDDRKTAKVAAAHDVIQPGARSIGSFALARQIGRRRGCDRLPARPSQDHVRTTEHGADARRQVGLPRSARRRLSPHDGDGRVHLGETIGCCVVRRIGVRR